jgi:hypothetical protein
VQWQRQIQRQGFRAQKGLFSPLRLPLWLSFTILRTILAHSFHSPVKTALLFLDRPVRHVRSMLRRIKKKGGKMPLFVIMHIYEVPAKNQYEATNELMTARQNHFDKVFLKKSHCQRC